MFGLGMQELVILGIVAVLLFGKRLPEVARSMGQSYNEFRKGLGEIQSSMDFSTSSYTPPPSSPRASSGSLEDYDDYDEPTAPKFEPPPSEPTPEEDAPSEDAPGAEAPSEESPSADAPSEELPKPIGEK